MSFAFIVYIISILNGLGVLFLMLSFIFAAASLYCVMCEKELKFNSSTKYITLVCAIISALICTAIPSKNDAYLIAGAYAAEKVYDSDVGQDVIALVQAKIKQQLSKIQHKEEK